MILLVLLALASPAWAHSWYDPACCSDRDCRPVPVTDLRENADGSWTYLPRQITFSRHQIRPSKDRHHHTCIGIHSGLPLCLYVLQGM
jgi:hypothetical protein